MLEKEAKYTQEELKQALLRLLNNNIHYIQAAGIPRACAEAAEICFMYKKPEDEDTALLRQALMDINTNGYFNYNK
jgi:hypothetical protein